MDTNNWKELEEYYHENDITNHNIIKKPENSPINTEFPDPQYNIYRSNCIEFWKPVTEKEVPGVDPNRYWISSWGNTWDIFLYKPIHRVCSKGNKYYVQARLHLMNGGAVTVKMHRLIMMLFWPVEDPTKYQVNHIDCTHDNNAINNLEWCNDSYNRLYSIVNDVGTNIFDKEIIMFTKEEVHQIKVLKDKGYNNRQIYNEMNLQSKGGFESIRKLIAKISTGRSKLFSRYYY